MKMSRSRSEAQREFDRIAASRMRLHGGGLPLHVALGSRGSLLFRYRLRRMGINPDEVKEAVRLVDEAAMVETLQGMPMSVRYATVARKQKKRPVWGKGLF